MNPRYLVLLLVVAATFNVDTWAQKTPTSVHGAPVVAITIDRERISGELIAVQADSLWILTRDILQPVSTVILRRVDVQRRNPTGSRFALYSLGVGVVNAALLTGACESVSDGCEGVFVASVALWGLATLAAAPGVSRAATLRVEQLFSENLRAYARYPHENLNAETIRCLVEGRSCELASALPNAAQTLPVTVETPPTAEPQIQAQEGAPVRTSPRRLFFSLHVADAPNGPEDDLMTALSAAEWNHRRNHYLSRFLLTQANFTNYPSSSVTGYHQHGSDSWGNLSADYLTISFDRTGYPLSRVMPRNTVCASEKGPLLAVQHGQCRARLTMQSADTPNGPWASVQASACE
jgi:hypothetical protein